MKTMLFGALALCVVLPGMAADTFTDSKPGDFVTGQRLVTCAAFFDFVSGISAQQGRPNAAENFENISRGWTLAGMLLLSSGAESPSFDSKQTAESIKSARLTALKAKFEMGSLDVLKEMKTEHERDCDPLVPLQEGVIQAMRSSAGASPKR